MDSDDLLFGKAALDDKVRDCPYKPDLGLQSLLDHFGQNVTWRTILQADHQEILSIPGIKSKMADRLYSFINDHVEYSFMDLI